MSLAGPDPPRDRPLGQAGMRTGLDSATVERIAETFQALADPTRVRIVAALHEREQSVGNLAGLVGVSPSAVSHQLSHLRRLHLVRTRRLGHRVLYSLDDEHVDRLWSVALEHVRHETPTRPS